MINTRKLVKMAKKWQMAAALRRKRVSFPANNVMDHQGAATSSRLPCLSPVTEKGHFVVYTADQRRYSFPIAHLNNYIFRELFKMAEKEFGLPRDGPITVPCDAVFMDYLISLMQRKATKEIEKALLFAACRCSSSYPIRDRETNQQLLLCSI